MPEKRRPIPQTTFQEPTTTDKRGTPQESRPAAQPPIVLFRAQPEGFPPTTQPEQPATRKPSRTKPGKKVGEPPVRVKKESKQPEPFIPPEGYIARGELLEQFTDLPREVILRELRTLREQRGITPLRTGRQGAFYPEAEAKAALTAARIVRKIDDAPKAAARRKKRVKKIIKGAAYWEKIPIDKRARLIESQARSIVGKDVVISLDYLRTHGHSALGRTITKYYPGGFAALREKLGVASTVRTVRPEWKTIPDPAAAIRAEVTQLLAQPGVQLTSEYLNQKGLFVPIQEYYPGGYEQLRKDFGLPPLRASSKELTPEKLRTEVAAIIQQQGKFSTGIAQELGRETLVSQIRDHYPGGISQLLQDLEQTPNRQSWTPEKIEELALPLFRRDGHVSTRALNEIPGLKTAASRHYPGQLTALNAKLQKIVEGSSE